MRVVILLFLLFIFGTHALAQRQRTVLDSTFGSNGIIMDNDDSVRMNSNRIALQPDGKMIVAGTYFYYLYPQSFDLVWEMCIMRLKPDGSRDSTFNGIGVIKKTLESGTRISALTLQPDEKILVTMNNGMLLRYLPSGIPDSSFNDSGQVKLTFLKTYDAAMGTALQKDGKIVLTGRVYDSYLLLTRLSSDGRLEDSFGFHGVVNAIIDSVNNMWGSGLSIQSDGKIVVTGGAEGKMIVLRFTANGSMDGSFGSGKGYVRIPFSGIYSSSGVSISLLPDGRMLIGGLGWNQGPNWTSSLIYCLARLKPSGILDSSFNGTGRLVIDSTPYPQSYPFQPMPATTLQADGKILMSMMNGSDLYDKHFSLRRFNADGSSDDTFGVHGQVVTTLSSKNDYPWDIAVQPDKKILLCGVADWDTTWPQSVHSAPSVVRYTTAVVPDTTGGDTSGADIVQIYPNPASDGYLRLHYRLADATDINVQLWNTLGQMVQQWKVPAVSGKVMHEEHLLLPKQLPMENYVVRVTAVKLQQASIILIDSR